MVTLPEQWVKTHVQPGNSLWLGLIILQFVFVVLGIGFALANWQAPAESMAGVLVSGFGYFLTVSSILVRAYMDRKATVEEIARGTSIYNALAGTAICGISALLTMVLGILTSDFGNAIVLGAVTITVAFLHSPEIPVIVENEIYFSWLARPAKAPSVDVALQHFFGQIAVRPK